MQFRLSVARDRLTGILGGHAPSRCKALMRSSAGELQVLLCFDGSDGAAAAIARAGVLLAPRSATVLTVWEPFELWAPYDPATVIDAGIAKVTTDSVDR